MRNLSARIHRPARLVLAIALLITACGSENSAADFLADTAPIEPELLGALDDDDDPEAVPEVQRNFLRGCVTGFGDGLPELEPVQRSGLLGVCGCSYDALVGYSYDQAIAPTNEEFAGSDTDPDEVLEALDAAALDVFTAIEEDLRTGEAGLPDAAADLIRRCIRTEAGL